MTKSKLLILVLLSLFTAGSLFSQKEYNLHELNVYEDETGRYIFRKTGKRQHLLNGTHKIIYNNQHEYFVAAFINGMLDGQYHSYKNQQLELTVYYKDGFKNGAFKRYTRFGDLASEGTFINDKMHGLTTTYYYTGQIESTYHYKEGKLHGVCKTYTDEGQLKSEQEYTDGLEDGIERRYSEETGALTLSCHYKNGWKEGKQFSLRKGLNGEYTEESFYVEGKLEGEYQETYINGQLRTKGVYKNGKKEGKWFLYAGNGIIVHEQNFINDKKEGVQKYYYPDGSLEAIANYVNGQQEGSSNEFYIGSGMLKAEYIYVDGIKEGRYKRYHDNGKLSEEGHIESDHEVYSKEYDREGKLELIRERKADGSWDILEQYGTTGNN